MTDPIAPISANLPAIAPVTAGAGAAAPAGPGFVDTLKNLIGEVAKSQTRPTRRPRPTPPAAPPT